MQIHSRFGRRLPRVAGAPWDPGAGWSRPTGTCEVCEAGVAHVPGCAACGRCLAALPRAMRAAILGGDATVLRAASGWMRIKRIADRMAARRRCQAAAP